MEVPYGFCQCGCGEKTNLAVQTVTRCGWIRGEPLRFVRGHWHRTIGISGQNPSGLCMCGCGNKCPIATRTVMSIGKVKGQPVKYIRGHWRRFKADLPEYLAEDRGYKTPCWIWQKSIGESGYGVIRSEMFGDRLIAICSKNTRGRLLMVFCLIIFVRFPFA